MRSEIMDGILRHIHPIGGIENTRLLEVSPGHARLSMEITEEALNLYGNVHGGFLFSLCDMAAGMSTYAFETTNVTECSSINFLRGVNTGTIYIESNAIHKGRKTVVNQVTVTNDAGKLVVSANFTMFLIAPV